MQKQRTQHNIWLLTGQPRNCSLIPIMVSEFSPVRSVPTVSGAHSASCTVGRSPVSEVQAVKPTTYVHLISKLMKRGPIISLPQMSSFLVLGHLYINFVYAGFSVGNILLYKHTASL
jgi:hypothetical protein